ncbi:MAG: 50S ribosomal protein L1 [Coprothermobacterota bacterium]|nr:50S ribosomal protein L1 [Coprothermobacterota bacterium]
MRHGKRYLQAAKMIEPGRFYVPEEAVSLLKQMPAPKFNETVELAVQLGIDPKKSDQSVRSVCVLPAGTGKTVKVLVFAKGEKVEEATRAGADYVGGEEYAKQVLDGWSDFDVAIATPDMMSVVGKLGKILRGKMPNPKAGTVTMELERAIREVKAGKIEFRADKQAVVHVPLGKMNFTEADLLTNLYAFLDTLVKVKPSTAKGQYIKGISLSSTMSPGIDIDQQKATAAAGKRNA